MKVTAWSQPGLAWALTLALMVGYAPGAAAQPPRPRESVEVARLVVDARVVGDDGHAERRYPCG